MLGADLFPRKIPFFHLGDIEQIDRAIPDPQAAFIVTFQLGGDETGLCAVTFDEAPAGEDEKSMAVEMANILASKFATRLSEAEGIFVSLSPPRVLDSTNSVSRNLLAGARSAASQSYEYRFENTRFNMRLIYLSPRSGAA